MLYEEVISNIAKLNLKKKQEILFIIDRKLRQCHSKLQKKNIRKKKGVDSKENKKLG